MTPNEAVSGSNQGWRKLRGAGWMALMQGLTFPLQAVLGGLIVLLLGMAGMELFPTFGFLVPPGFNEGPSQALSIGNDGIQRRITGWSVDYLIVATVAAIQLKIVW